ncbi:MAG: hypothetical protein WA417_12405, partial [Stellaceae bacterium]
SRLAVALPSPALVHWGHDGWRDVADVATTDTGLGFHVAALDAQRLAPGMRIDFTWLWQDSESWTGRDCAVTVEPAADPG